MRYSHHESNQPFEPTISMAMDRAGGALLAGIIALVLAIAGTAWLAVRNHAALEAFNRQRVAELAQQTQMRTRLDAMDRTVATLQAENLALRKTVSTLQSGVASAEHRSASLARQVAGAATAGAEAQARADVAAGVERAQLAALTDSLRSMNATLGRRLALSEAEITRLQGLEERVAALDRRQTILDNKQDPVGLRLWRAAVTVGVPIGILTGVGR